MGEHKAAACATIPAQRRQAARSHDGDRTEVREVVTVRVDRQPRAPAPLRSNARGLERKLELTDRKRLIRFFPLSVLL